jgi:hypothetical protein
MNRVREQARISDFMSLIRYSDRLDHERRSCAGSQLTQFPKETWLTALSGPGGRRRARHRNTT